MADGVAFEAHMERYEGGWTVWINRKGKPSNYPGADSAWCFTKRSAGRWARRAARREVRRQDRKRFDFEVKV